MPVQSKNPVSFLKSLKSLLTASNSPAKALPNTSAFLGLVNPNKNLRANGLYFLIRVFPIGAAG